MGPRTFVLHAALVTREPERRDLKLVPANEPEHK